MCLFYSFGEVRHTFLYGPDAEVVSEVVLAARPGNGFGDDTDAATTSDAAHTIVEAHGDVPEGNVVE